jgi:hypothetical protein
MLMTEGHLPEEQPKEEANPLIPNTELKADPAAQNIKTNLDVQNPGTPAPEQ